MASTPGVTSTPAVPGAPPAPVGSKKGMTPSPSQLVGIGLVAIGVIVLLTLVLAFHHPTASDTTSVLGVALPALTAIVGAALGGGAGNAVGSAGKRSV
jgi:hypothetical protein